MRLYKRRSETKLEEKINILEKEKQELTELLTRKNQDTEGISQAIIDLEEIGIAVKKNKEDNIVFSEASLKILGLSSETMKKEDFLNMVANEDRQAVRNFISENVENEKTASIEYKIIKLNQEREVRYISSKSIYLKKNKKGVFTIKDVTRQEKIKKELVRAKEKSEESDKVKNAFLTNISHEIRVPMNSIVGFAELINIGNISPDDRLKYIKIIKHQSNQLLKLIDDISEIAKFEAGEIKINKTSCNLNLLLNELFVYFNQQIKLLKKDQIEINLSIPDKKGINVYTDSGRLHQLLSNLLNNAVKYTEKGVIDLGYTQKDEKIEFFVKDTGIGLTKEEQKHIFDRFKKNEETLTRKYEGSGLGLTIARGIVKLLGGKIWIESESGKGSAFYFNIPFEQISDQNLSQIDEEYDIHKFNWKGKIMLVVEDDEVNFKFIEALLNENQTKVLRASNGLQAIELCKTINKIDMILMDIRMPQMDGYEATREIRKFNRTIPIIAQTAFASEEEKERCLEAGCNEQVAKPIDIEELLSKINKFLMP